MILEPGNRIGSWPSGDSESSTERHVGKLGAQEPGRVLSLGRNQESPPPTLLRPLAQALGLERGSQGIGDDLHGP